MQVLCLADAGSSGGGRPADEIQRFFIGNLWQLRGCYRSGRGHGGNECSLQTPSNQKLQAYQPGERQDHRAEQVTWLEATAGPTGQH